MDMQDEVNVTYIFGMLRIYVTYNATCNVTCNVYMLEPNLT